MPDWLRDAIFYEIYPQSFYDTNADGIGDLEGIIEKLDYVKELGCNALWINPCYDSPFKDAGYDVRDYLKIAERYGTNEDMYRLFEEAHKRGIKVLLDLVPGHTSEEHAWFRESSKDEKNAFTDRYVWTNGAFVGIKDHLYIGGESPRDAVYLLNFFKCQPALNYGWGQKTEVWQTKAGEGPALETREAMKAIMRFWLDKGCDGFRVDMADSLVKDDDENKSNTQAVWKNVRQMMDQDYPEAALVAEWSNPYQAIPGGFHMDFYLDHHYNGYNTLLRDYETPGGDHSYFKKDGGGDIRRFLDDYLPKYQNSRGKGYISMFTCNHDTPRPARTLSVRELMVAYSFLFTMPGVPFLYYGDEIGMIYQEGLKSKEGGYARTGSRTPMQWNGGKNAGFSAAEADQLYLPVDGREDAPDVEKQAQDPASLLNMVKEILHLRHREEDLQADGEFEVILADKDQPFIYRRGSLVCLVNPTEAVCELDETWLKKAGLGQNAEKLYEVGLCSIETEKMTVGAQSFAVFRMV